MSFQRQLYHIKLKLSSCYPTPIFYYAEDGQKPRIHGKVTQLTTFGLHVKFFHRLPKTVTRQPLNPLHKIFLPRHLLQGGPICSGISLLSSSSEMFHI